jgi:spermidine synthase
MIPLECVETNFGTIHVFKRRKNGAIIYEQRGCQQSEADNNGVSFASYIHAIFALIQQSKAQKILLIGCAGGTLATMLARANKNVTVIDVNPASFRLARQYFSLPNNVHCEIADGKSFLQSNVQIYDAIVIDAYHGGHIPAHLKSFRFYSLVRERLSQRGALFANIHVGHAFDRRVDRIAECMSMVFPDVRLLDSRAFTEHNAIVMAGSVKHLDAPKLLVPLAVDCQLIESELAVMKFRAWR